MRIGIDFDNTIAGYDKVFVALALEEGLIPEPLSGGKRAVREGLRGAGGGEVEWRKLQATAYGPRMAEAELTPGLSRFLIQCRRRGAALFIVSHKTRFANHGGERFDLREAALSWMVAKGFFTVEGFGLAPEQVFFEGTRAEKLARIADLGLSHFIDDLEEVLNEPAFPDGAEAILYAPHLARALPAQSPSGRYTPFADWDQITEHLFGARD